MSDLPDTPPQDDGALEASEPTEELAEESPGVPWVTYTVIAVCVLIFAYLNLFEESASYPTVTETLAPSAIAIWAGNYWALVTSAFVHFAFWHILFNMWWARDFGTILEPTMGRGRYLLFIAAAAVVSSGCQLALSDQTGIGFSGVVYAMFGYGLAARSVEPRYQHIISKQTVQWLLGWLVLCIVLSVADVWNVANAAHVGGFLFGFFAGNAFTARRHVQLYRAGLALLALVVALSLTYMPWSESWRLRDEIAAYLAAIEGAYAGDPSAQYLYGQSLIVEGNKAEGVSWLRKSAEQGNVSAMNDLAWTLATDLEEAIRDGEEAVKWGEQACETDGWERASYVDTLAAAYAETGQWAEAVATQELAIGKLTEEEKEGEASYEARLRKYLNQERHRQ